MTLVEFIQSFTVPATMLLVFGLGMLVVEMFTPGFGVPGLMGIISLVACVVIKARSLAEALWMVIGILALVGVMLLIFLRSATQGKLSKTPIVNNEKITESSGYIDMEDLKYYVGKKGRTLTNLRPAGIADFDGVRLDVVTEGGFIKLGCNIKVVKVEGRKIVVEEAEA